MMKKIATITFHWATNYGAVLQAYALQKYLENSGYEAEIIDYVPFRIKLLSNITWIRHKKISEFKREKLIRKFRNAELNLSKKRYRSCKDLKSGDFEYDCIISGSDQIWNKNFTLNLDGKPNLSYFLDFIDKGTVKLAYAVSFGATFMPDEYYDCVKNFVNNFQAISVREQTAIPIIEKMGRKAEVVCDPTLLLARVDYEKLIEKKFYQSGKVFCYILHDNQNIAQRIAREVKIIYEENDEDLGKNDDIYAWLYKIKNSEIVITNSFHGTMFALIFNTPFIVVPVEGFDMNDRIKTILDVVHLEKRFISSVEADVLRSLCSETIDWEQVNQLMEQYSRLGKEFLLSNIEHYVN